MQHDLEEYLSDIVTRCQRIQIFTAGLTVEVYQQTDLVRWAVERAFIAIGESLVCAGRLVPDLQERLPDAGKVIAFRNILVHNYLDINEKLVWTVIQDHVPLLEQQTDAWLRRLGSGTVREFTHE